ncbi:MULTISPECIES: EAL domain-containing protein [Rhodopseudomonas]|uniref:sensor domain-containing phosphodiesterase n=1 Tax=Rhodopseudomonas TaxID=1073 RepID=UPI000697CB53|nr:MULTISPECIES: EAL domain-containing protein [Rhodopseudomonas]MDF3810008.1 EAL domain-containing protein [Rhodopseudomonas sp. BAL398]WOK20434.1 EAL domain-containing protein [Rhodopseudomonas sp. BAL398]
MSINPDTDQPDGALGRLFAPDAQAREEASDRIKRALQAVRSHLGLQVAYVSRFDGNLSVYREVDAPGLEHMIKPGDRYSLDDVYCRHILEGRLPELMPDTADEPLAAAMPITKTASIGSHLSVPIRLPDGRPYGMFCCLGFAPDKSLNERDLQMMKAFADIAAFEINREMETEQAIASARARIEGAIARDELSIVFQPIWNIANMVPVGFECLSRFSAAPYRSPDQWFAEAAEVDLGVALELEAIRRALSGVRHFPAPTYLTFNASPAAILDPDFAAVCHDAPLDKLVVEITEHSTVGNYEDLLAVLDPLRRRGLRLAVDDAGAGYSSLRHILNMRPDFIKLDIGLTQNIDLDPARKALARALVGFAADTGSRIVAEGVERRSELEALRSIGVRKVQGYLLGRPMPLEQALRLTRAKPADKVNVA